jgi:UDPglucose 6-dehydrogenase
MPNAKAQLPGSVVYAQGVPECAEQADVLAITTPWAEFRSLRPAHMKQSAPPPVVLDCWRLLSRKEFQGAATYLTLGAGEVNEPELAVSK